MDTENTSPDDLASTTEETQATAEPAPPEANQDKSPENTEETTEVQAEAAPTSPEATESATPEGSNPSTPAAPKPTPKIDSRPDWVKQISRYHNDMNGLLAGKENLKIMAVNKSVRPSFYKKWVFEANAFARLTVNLRHRKLRALAKLKERAEEASKTDTAA